MLVNRLPHAENSWQPLEKFSKRLITFPLPEASCWSRPLRSMTNRVNIRTCSQDSETLSHAPVKAWPTNTPGGFIICCNLLVPVPKSFTRSWRMKTAEDESSWSSPKGTLPWSEGTNVMDCSCQHLLGDFQHCSWPRTTFQFNWPSTKQPIQPSSCPRDVTDSWAGLSHGHCPVPAEALGWTTAGKVLPCHPVYAGSSWDDFPDSIVFPWPENTMHAFVITNCASLFSEDGL